MCEGNQPTAPSILGRNFAPTCTSERNDFGRQTKICGFGAFDKGSTGDPTINGRMVQGRCLNTINTKKHLPICGLYSVEERVLESVYRWFA